MGMNWLRGLALAVVAVGFVVPVVAQEQKKEERKEGERREGDRRRGPRGMGLDIMGLVANPQISSYLKISADQQAFIKLFADERQAADRKYWEENRDTPREERMKLFTEWSAKRNAEVESKLGEIVGAPMVKRLKEIHVQVMGVRMFMFDPSLQKTLDFSDAQKEQLREIGGNSMREMFQMPRDLSEEERAKKFEEMNKSVTEKVLAVMNDQQKAKWKEMQGEPLPFKLELPRFGGRGPGGPPRREGGDRPESKPKA